MVSVDVDLTSNRRNLYHHPRPVAATTTQHQDRLRHQRQHQYRPDLDGDWAGWRLDQICKTEYLPWAWNNQPTPTSHLLHCVPGCSSDHRPLTASRPMALTTSPSLDVSAHETTSIACFLPPAGPSTRYTAAPIPTSAFNPSKRHLVDSYASGALVWRKTSCVGAGDQHLLVPRPFPPSLRCPSTTTPLAFWSSCTSLRLSTRDSGWAGLEGKGYGRFSLQHRHRRAR